MIPLQPVAASKLSQYNLRGNKCCSAPQKKPVDGVRVNMTSPPLALILFTSFFTDNMVESRSLPLIGGVGSPFRRPQIAFTWLCWLVSATSSGVIIHCLSYTVRSKPDG